MYDILKKILVEDLHLPEADIRPEARRVDAGIDSLAVVELSMLLDRRLNLVIGDDELLEAATVADLAQLLERRAAGA